MQSVFLFLRKIFSTLENVVEKNILFVKKKSLFAKGETPNISVTIYLRTIKLYLICGLTNDKYMKTSVSMARG